MLIRFIAILLCGALISCTPKSENSTKKEVDTPSDTEIKASSIDLPIYDNFTDIEHLFHKNNDTTYVINIWATWCKPCVRELPYFEQLTEKYKNEKFKTILVSLDFPKQIETKLKPFIQNNKLQSEVIVLTDSKQEVWIDKIDKDWDGAIPVILIYKNDKRKFIYGDVHDFEELDQLVIDILKS